MQNRSGCSTVFLRSAAVIIFIALSGSALFGQTAAQGMTDPLKLDQVIISATKTEHTLGDVPVAADVITREEIEQKQVTTVQDALRYLPGVKINQTSSSWGDKGKVQMQGLDERHTLILVDGQRFLGGHGDAIDLQSIPIDMVERIEVVKGPASSLYGSDAIGGVVNIITRGPAGKPTFSGSSSFGSRGTQIHQATAGYGKGAFGSLFNYTYRESDGVEKETDRYSEHIFQGSIGYRFSPDSRLTVKPYYSEHKMSYEGRTQERAGVNSVWEWTPDRLSRLNVRGSLFDYKHFTDDKSSNWDTGSYEGEVTYSRLLFDKHMVTGGYQYFREDIDDKGKVYKADQNLHSFYIQDEMNYAPFVVVLGTRIDFHDRWGNEVDPKVSMLYNVTKDLKIRGSVGAAFKGPSLVKLYGDGWRMGPYIVHANPELKPESSVGYQLGMEYSFLDRFLGKLSLFRNDIDDLINSRIVRGSHPPYNMYWENIDKAVTQGVELSLAAQVMKDLTARLGYTFLDTEDKTLHEDLTYRPKHKATLELNQKFPEVGLNINVAAEYIGQRYDSSYNKLGGYTLCNVAVTKGIGRHLQVFARADNIFGKEAVTDEYDIDGTRYLAGLKLSF
jgi:outer membrane receptor for ferrienterochelin and colicin